MSSPAVDRVRSTPFFSSKDLMSAWVEWPSLSSDEKALFHADRRDVIAGFDKSHFSYMDMRTSGTTGAARTYRHGPVQDQIQEFFQNLVYDGFERDATITVRVSHDQSVQGIRVKNIGTRWHPAHRHVVIESQSLTTDSLRGFLTRLGRTAIISAPGFVNELRRHGVDLSALDPARVLFVNTGEKPLRDEVDLLAFSGHHIRDFMRCWDGGFTFYTCRHGGKHIVDLLCQHKIEGRALISSDPFNLVDPHLDYRNGDHLSISDRGGCACGYLIQHIEFEDRKLSVRIFHDQPATYMNMSSRYLFALISVFGPKGYEVFMQHSYLGFGFHDRSLVILRDGPPLICQTRSLIDAFAAETALPASNISIVDHPRPANYKRYKFFDMSQEEFETILTSATVFDEL